MIVFKTFLKILKKNLGVIILYTVILVAFGGLNMKTNDTNPTHFQNTRPSIYIINEDKESAITKNLVQYLEEQCEIVELSDNQDAIADALFYREMSYIIKIPPDYERDFLDGKHPDIIVESTGDYEATYAEMVLSRYLKVADIYQQIYDNEEMIIDRVNDTLGLQVSVEITSKVNTDQLSQASYYYNFISYSLLAGCLYVICSIFSSFKELSISKRITVSSMNEKKHHLILLLSNGLLAFVLWLIYVLLSFVLVGQVMLTRHGMIYIFNSFVFSVCTLTIAFFIAQLLKDKNVINGIVNVIALGSSFLCGAFVSVEYLPDFVLKIAHILPSYWYIQNNEIIESLEIINLESLTPVFINVGVICIFSFIFIMMSMMISKVKAKMN